MPPNPQPSEPASNVLDLRAALEQMREEAQREITRLSRKLADRDLEAEGRGASATEGVALQQELVTLQRALVQKGEALDQITSECRRLEDELEDQHLIADDLKQEVQRREDALKTAREEAQRLQRQLDAIQAQSIDPSEGPGQPDSLSAVASSWALAPLSLIGTPLRGISFGILSALVMVGVLGLLIARTLGLPGFPGGSLSPVVSTSDAALAPAPQAEAIGQLPRSGQTTGEPPGVASDTLRRPQPSAPRTLRDPLAGGGQGPTLSLLPAGAFRMGLSDLAGGDTIPERDLQVGAFGIGTHEVTFAHYDRFARATGRRLPEDFGWGRGDRPVVGVSWSDAEAYVVWLSHQTGQRYRLPSESEWEFAARGGGRGSYWWGFGVEPGRAACFNCRSPWDNRSTAPVGSFPPSPYGLYDTAGNVMEWVADCYHPSYQGAPLDGRARQDPDCRLRIARGGAFNKPSASMRAYVRTKLDPETRLSNLGFRVARDP